MFIGEYKHSVDDKGRVAIPAKFRSDLSHAAVITRGLDHCLYVFTAAAWMEIAGKIKALPMTNANARAFQRLMLAGAAEVELDTQGRALIPDYLREYANLPAGRQDSDKHVVIAGVYDRIEIWNDEAWKSYKEKTEAAGDEIAERLGELGI